MTFTPPAGTETYFTALSQVQKKYPDIYAWLVTQPEVLQVYLKSQDPANPMTDAQLQAALQNTNYYKTSTVAQRSWDQLIATDPAEAQNRYTTGAQHITQLWQQGGYSIPYTQFLQLNNQAIRGDWSDATIKAAFAAAQAGLPMPSGANESGDQNGDLQTNMDQIKQTAASYAIPLSDQAAYKWSLDIMSGASTTAGFTDYAKNQAKSLFPGLSSALDAGQTVDQYADPYKQIAVKELNIKPDDINWTDPKWNAALHQIDPKTGNPVSMSLSDWTNKIRSDPSYGYDSTPGAVQQAAQFATQIAQKFGGL